jgi:hypothetical protein
MTLGEAVRWAAWRGEREPDWGATEFEDGTWISHGDLEEQDRLVYAEGADKVRDALASGAVEAWAQTGYDDPVRLPKARWSSQLSGSIGSWIEFYHPFDRIIVERARVLAIWPKVDDPSPPRGVPDPDEARLPPEKSFVALSEAVTWIAFGVSMDRDQLHEVLALDRFGESVPQQAIKDAVTRLAALGGEGKVTMRGKYRERRDHDHKTLLTAPIQPIKLEDYRQFNYLEDELRHGEGLLFWHSDGTTLDYIFGEGRKDSFLQVTVNRAELLREFPPRESFEQHHFGCGKTFRRDDPVTIAPWWSVNQALAWVATRIPSYVEYVGRLETDEPHEYRPHFVQAICDSQIAESDEGKAFMECRRATWPTGTCIAHAGRALLEKILRSEVRPMTREGGKGREMRTEEFVGIGTRDTGEDWLELDPPPQFVSAELIRAFPPSEHAPAASGEGIVPSNRQLDHGEIVSRAAALLRHQPGLSRGSAAASIVAELPTNPRTGKPRDTRHIERMIGHLWEGGLPESPR